MKWLPGVDYFRNNVAMRNDTILGVCEALGSDLGFNPNFLRVPLAAGIIFAPLLMIGIYAVLGVIAFASRTFFPDRTVVVAAEPVVSAAVDSVANEQAVYSHAA